MVSHAPLSTELSLHTQARSAVHVPISADNRPLGVVSFYYTHTENPDPALVSQISFQQQAMEALVNLSDARRQQKNLFRAAQKMLETAKADWCEIAIWDGARNGFYVMLAYGEAIWHDERRPSIILNQLPQLGQMLDTQTPFTGSLLDQQDQRRLLELGRGKSFLALPLVIKGKTAGLVFLTDTLYHRHFSRREVELAQALILQAANALDNARLFRDLELSLLELRRTQSKLVQTARLTAMGELAAAIAHQINNPLTTILGDAELLLQDITPEDSTYESLEAISRAGRRAHEVVRRLLGMARQQPLEDIIEAVDVNDTINNTLALVRSHIQQGSVGLDVQLSDLIPAVVGIRGQLEDVWLNLLMNARDAVVGRPKPRIGISTRLDSGESRVVIEVWDNGIGIPTEIQQQVFEPFFTTKPTGEGTGLGLHICHQVVEKCGGSITVQSTYNEGTRFIIYLPLFTRRVGI
jgi:signal transduction histidine kinase